MKDSKTWRTLSIALFAIILAGCSSSITDPDPTIEDEVAAEVETVRNQHNLPAMGVLTMHDGSVFEMGVSGYRVSGSDEEVTKDDLWHLGSLTKSMTSLLVGALVENGVITWGTTIGEVFPELIGQMRPEYSDVSIDELLTHTGGMPSSLSSIPSWDSYGSDTSPIETQRMRITTELLNENPGSERGSYEYSNPGYVIAGTMLERLTGMSWENLMRQFVFIPLGMDSAGFGAPGLPGIHDEPWGHVKDGGKWYPLDPAMIEADNPAVVGPAGTVHASMNDVSKYLADQLRGSRGENGLVSAATYAKLHTPAPGTGSASGWEMGQNGALFHLGSNDRWLATMVIAPQENVAIFTATNAASEEAFVAVNDLFAVFAQRLQKEFGSAQ